MNYPLGDVIVSCELKIITRKLETTTKFVAKIGITAKKLEIITREILKMINI